MNLPKTNICRPCDLPILEITVRVKDFCDILDPRGPAGPRLTRFTMEESFAQPAKGALCIDDGDYQNRREPSRRVAVKSSEVEDASASLEYKKETVHVPLPGAILRFEITGELGQTNAYRPVGIAFRRADDTPPAAVAWSTGEHPLPLRPFSAFELNGHYVQITDIPQRRVMSLDPEYSKKPWPRWITYKFSIFIQRDSDGAIGIIDPYIENENR